METRLGSVTGVATCSCVRSWSSLNSRSLRSASAESSSLSLRAPWRDKRKKIDPQNVTHLKAL